MPNTTSNKTLQNASGKQYFRECCRELNIDCDMMFILGAQESRKKPYSDSIFRKKFRSMTSDLLLII